MKAPNVLDIGFPNIFKQGKKEYLILSSKWQSAGSAHEAGLTLLLHSDQGVHYLSYRIINWDKDDATAKIYFVLDESRYVQIITDVTERSSPLSNSLKT